MQEAIGRATEMGRPILYVPGIAEVDDIQTIASMNFLAKVVTAAIILLGLLAVNFKGLDRALQRTIGTTFSGLFTFETGE